MDKNNGVVPYLPALECWDIRESVEDLRDTSLALLVDEHGQKYGPSGKIKLPSWREVIMAVRDTNVDPRDLNFVYTSSYAVQARREAYKESGNDEKKRAAVAVEFPFVPCTVIGVPCTLDNKIICGVRGGSRGVGKADVPGGYLNYTGNCRQFISPASFGEIREEIGIVPGQFESHRLIGHFIDNQHNTLCFILRAGVIEDSEKILENHKRAFDLYQEMKSADFGEMYSREAIANRGHVCIDAWEHTKLFTIPNKRETWEEIVKSGKVSDGKETYEPLRNMVAAFELLLEHDNRK